MHTDTKGHTRTHEGTHTHTQTCHGVWNDSYKEPLVSHLHAHVRVLHGHNHFLHLSGGTHTHTQRVVTRKDAHTRPRELAETHI